MKKSIEEYVKKIDKDLESKRSDDYYHSLLREHLDKINFYQHERLIHLIVTISFAFLFITVFLYLLSNFSILLLFLSIMLLLLLIPYLLHYYFLENSVQRMYEQYDLIRNKF